MCSTGSAVVEQVLAGAGGVNEEILALVDLAGRVEAALVERVGAFDAAEGWKADGAYSFATWLAARADVTRTDGGRLGRLARMLRTMPVTERALDDGKLSVAKARLLAGVINERTRARFDEHESFLVDHIQGLDLDQAKVVLAHWKGMADTDGPEPGDPTRNRASLTTGLDGRWHLDADFDPASGAIIQAVLAAITDRMHQDGRFNDLGPDNTAARRAADGFVEMAMRASGRNPDQPAVHPDIVVVVPHRWLLRKDPDPLAEAPELLGVGPLDGRDVLRLALFGTISTMTVDDHGRPLDLGRKQRLASSDQRIALWYRDRECVVPGCHRPASWCAAHHLRFWCHGGPTDLDNLGLTCDHHHHLIHDQRWSIARNPGGAWQLTRPDGTRVAPPRYPGNQPPPSRAGPQPATGGASATVDGGSTRDVGVAGIVLGGGPPGVGG